MIYEYNLADLYMNTIRTMAIKKYMFGLCLLGLFWACESPNRSQENSSNFYGLDSLSVLSLQVIEAEDRAEIYRLQEMPAKVLCAITEAEGGYFRLGDSTDLARGNVNLTDAIIISDSLSTALFQEAYHLGNTFVVSYTIGGFSPRPRVALVIDNSDSLSVHLYSSRYLLSGAEEIASFFKRYDKSIPEKRSWASQAAAPFL